MIFPFTHMDFSDEAWIYIILQYLREWTEIPLSSTAGYDIEKLKFFDGFLGSLLRYTEEMEKNTPRFLNRVFVDSWKYQGKLYRVMHANLQIDEDGNESMIMPVVDYHGMITHWTDDYTFSGLLSKLSEDSECIILEADTRERIAFDVNAFRRSHSVSARFTEKEREFIFPMYQEHIIEHRLTIREFTAMKKSELEGMV